MFNIKIYEKDGTTFKDTIEVEKLENLVSFTSQINGGLGAITVGIAYKINNTSIENDDIIKVQYLTQEIYVGYITNITRIYRADEEVVNFTAYGLSSLLQGLLTSNNYTSNTASEIMRDLISDFNGEYGSNILSHDISSIPDSVGNLAIDFSGYSTYLDAMKEVSNTSGLTFTIDRNGKVFLRSRNLFSKHSLTMGRDVSEIEINEDAKTKVNSLILKYDGVGSPKTYNAPSITNKKEKYEDKSNEIKNVTTADVYGASFIDKNSEEVKKISIVVKNKYNFFDIIAGDLVDVRNLNYDVSDLQVARITYTIESARIELEQYTSFAEEIFNG